jgi:ParB family chromosome partitioning protein
VSESPLSPTTRRRRFTVDDLLADTSPQARGTRELAEAREIALDRIEPDPDQPRRTFDPERLEELAASIRQQGVLQPIAVRYDATRDRYVIIHGERRWRAAQLAGLATIPAIVRQVSDEQRLIQQLMENILREDLNALDRAAALRRLKQQLGDVPWEQVAETVGIKRSRLFQLLATEKLPEPVQEAIRAGRLSEKQTRPLQGLPEPLQIAVAQLIEQDGLPQAEIERLARTLRERTDLALLDPRELLPELRQLIRPIGSATPRPARSTRRSSRAVQLVTALERLRQLLETTDPATLDRAEREVITEAFRRLGSSLHRWRTALGGAPESS